MDSNLVIAILAVVLLIAIGVVFAMHMQTYRKFITNNDGYRPLTRKETAQAVEKGVEDFALKYNVVSPLKEEEIDLASTVK